MRVVVGLSGGVDSSVAAARLLDAGHEVTAVHLAMARPRAGAGPRGCAVPGALADAEAVADALGVPLEVWDFGERFAAEVVDHFAREYAAGRTPNPCLRCNERVKFAALLERALARGFDAVATGHYARVTREGGTPTLRRAADAAKDQSYVLGVLDQRQLERVWFPLGDDTKAVVRAEAVRRGLPTATRPDSVDICFIADGDAAGWLRDRLGERPGPVVDADGAIVGSHTGAYQFTVGQRRGLRLGRPAADGRPRFVLGVDPATNTVTVGPRELLAVRTLTGVRPTWTSGPRSGRWRGHVQVRAHGAPLPATFAVAESGREVRIELDEPAFGVAPGQGAVAYDGDVVVGSATIDATES